MSVTPVEPGPALRFPYRLLLVPYPRPFLEEFGSDISRHVLLQRAESRYAGSLGGTLRFWWDASTDALRAGLQLRLEDAVTITGSLLEQGGVGMAVQAMLRARGPEWGSVSRGPG